MLDRRNLLALAIGGVLIAAPTARCLAQSAGGGTAQVASPKPSDEKAEKEDKEKGEKEDKDEEKGEQKGEEREDGEKKEQKEIEQAVPLAMVPGAVLDAVKKEVPGGTITEAELEAKKGKIVWGFDVKAADMAYDVNITVDGKFYSKKVDDESDEKDEKVEKKPEASEKK